MDLEALLQQLADDPDAVSDDALASAIVELRELIAEATDGDDPDVELADELVPALATVVQVQQDREQAAADRLDRAAQIRRDAGIDPADDDAPDADDDDDDAPDAAGDPATADREPVPATASTAALVDRLRAAAAARRRQDPDPAPSSTLTVRAVGPAVGHDLQLNSLRDAAVLFARYGGHVGRKQRSSLLRFDLQLPDDRVLGDDAESNTRKLDAVTSPRAVTAAGGICEPVEADYDHPICGDRGRPIRDALPTFQASRGGIRYAPTPTLADVVGGITTWTAANDATPGSDGPATKACPAVDCDTEVSVSVDAQVACLTVGNFQARFSPEFWQSRLDLLMVAHDRVSEQALLAGIDAGSTAVTYDGAESHTVVDVLQAIDKATAGLASRHRIIDGTYVAIVPDWLPNAFRAALAHNQSSNRMEAYAAADAALAQFWASRMVRPVYSPDADVFGTQAVGALAEWPGGDVVVRLFPEGTWTFLDGGVLDLGTEVSDSTLNSTNDRQAFVETFEQVAFRGCESLAITVPAVEGCVCATAVETAP